MCKPHNNEGSESFDSEPFFITKNNKLSLWKKEP